MFFFEQLNAPLRKLSCNVTVFIIHHIERYFKHSINNYTTNNFNILQNLKINHASNF